MEHYPLQSRFFPRWAKTMSNKRWSYDFACKWPNLNMPKSNMPKHATGRKKKVVLMLNMPKSNMPKHAERRNMPEGPHLCMQMTNFTWLTRCSCGWVVCMLQPLFRKNFTDDCHCGCSGGNTATVCVCSGLQCLQLLVGPKRPKQNNDMMKVCMQETTCLRCTAKVEPCLSYEQDQQCPGPKGATQ